jgi:hypothetical protein
LKRNPPRVASYALFFVVLLSVVCSGDLVVHESEVIVSRSVAWNSLPPDLVSMLTTPPVNRPYSAETPDVVVVVSWTASSM